MWPVKNRVVSPFLFFFLPEYTMRMEKRPTSTECQSVPLNVPWPSSTWRVLQSWPEWWTTHTRICRRAICRSNRCFWKRLIPIHLLTSAVSLVGGPDQWLLSMHRYEWWKTGHSVVPLKPRESFICCVQLNQGADHTVSTQTSTWWSITVPFDNNPPLSDCVKLNLLHWSCSLGPLLHVILSVFPFSTNTITTKWQCQKKKTFLWRKYLFIFCFTYLKWAKYIFAFYLCQVVIYRSVC